MLAVEAGPAVGPTITDRLLTVAASSTRPVRFLDGGVETTTWSSIVRGAERRAGGLRQKGIEPGQRVALHGPTSRALIEALFGTWFAGAVPVLLPRAGRRGAVDVAARLRAANAALLVDDERGEGVGDVGVPTVAMASLDGPPVVEAPSPTAVVQFTSGSTGAPKGIRISAAAVLANLAAIHDAVELDVERDRAISWLPLYHDMGLVGTFLGAAVAGLEAAYAPTERFALRPGLWMRACSELGSTILAGSDHGFALAARALERAAADVDLSAVRVAMCGGEVIRSSTLAAFEASAGRRGWRPEAFMPCYGLAEATLAVTMSRATEPPTIDRPGSWAEPTGDLLFDARAGIVGVGAPVLGCEVRIDTDGFDLDGRHVGEILVRSAARMDGYERDGRLVDETDPATWLATGDLGYVRDGQLHVCGRRKEVIVLNGRNVAPVVLEQLACTVPGVRDGGAAAFAVASEDGGESAVLAVEPTRVSGGPDELALAVGRHVADAVGFRPRRIIVVRPGALPRTTSGKLRRDAARAALAAGTLALVGEHQA